MTRLPFRRCIIGLVLLAAAAAAPGAETEDVPAAHPSDIERQIQAELERLGSLQEKLIAVRNAPVPERAAPVPASKTKDPAEKPKPKPIPVKAVKGAEEEFANALYALGRYDRARAVYQDIVDNGPGKRRYAWAMLQLGNCARKKNDFVTALGIYEKLLSRSPRDLWAQEAAWWAGEIKWRLLWDKTASRQTGRVNAPQVPQTTPGT